jgi:PRTRC genetic system protein B
MMNNTTEITNDFRTLYHPRSALVFYQAKGRDADTYVEYFDMDRNGTPINAHPLTVREANRLAKALNTTKEEEEPFLRSKGIMGNHILHIDAINSNAVWFTQAIQRELHFTEGLGIAAGKASVPPLLWIANRRSLSVFALGSNRRPTKKTKLYHAPFFNVYENGNVCMGTVDVQIKKTASLEEFIAAWENYFFNSYFSHLMQNHNPIKGNLVTLWKELIGTGHAFPKEVLKKSNRTL